MALISNGIPLPPQALAESTPMAMTSHWVGHDGMPLIDQWASYSVIYRSQPVLSALIDKVADLTARLTLEVKDYTDPDAPTVDRDSAYAKLIADPCPYMNPYSFWQWWVSTWEIYGEVFGFKLRDRTGTVIGICPMHPTRTWIERDENGNELFRFTLGAANIGILECRREDVLLQRRYNPDTPMRGLSRLHSLTRTVQNEDAIRTSLASTWKRGAQPIVAFKVDTAANKQALERLREQVEDKHSGPSKAGGVLILPRGVDPVPLQIDPLKMQLIESLKLTREEIAIRLDFPPPALHILDHATFSNITEQMRSVYRDSLAYRLEDIEAALDWDLRPEFEETNIRRARFNLDEVLRGDFEVRVASATSMVQAGVSTPNEGRAMAGLPKSDDPNADRLYANSALQPLGFTPAGQPAGVKEPVPGEVAKPIQATAQRLDQPVQRSISGRLGRKVTDQSSRDDRLTAYQEEFHAAISSVVDEQRKSVLSMVTKAWSVGDFDGPLTEALSAATTAVATNAGRTVDKKYKPADELAIEDQSADAAHGINAMTMTAVNEALDAGADADTVGQLFETRLALLAITARTLATRWLNEAESDAHIRFRKATQKTWVAGPNPRPSHARMSGETVGAKGRFSNGLRHPGEGISDTANCNCSLNWS